MSEHVLRSWLHVIQPSRAKHFKHGIWLQLDFNTQYNEKLDPWEEHKMTLLTQVEEIYNHHVQLMIIHI